MDEVSELDIVPLAMKNDLHPKDVRK